MKKTVSREISSSFRMKAPTTTRQRIIAVIYWSAPLVASRFGCGTIESCPPRRFSSPIGHEPTMSFLHFGLLALLPLAAIPVVLHLLTLHRLKTVELSTFRFLFDSYIQQRRRMQFLEALLAMLRTLFLVAAVLMIAGLVLSSHSSLFGAGGGGK